MAIAVAGVVGLLGVQYVYSSIQAGITYKENQLESIEKKIDDHNRKLTDAKLRNLSEPGKHFDGGGLYLDFTKAGGRYWRMKYRYAGKEKLLALGVYPAVGLKDARDQAAQARTVLQAGGDPGELRKASKAQAVHEAANTLEAVARDWHQHQAARWEPDTAGRIQTRSPSPRVASA